MNKKLTAVLAATTMVGAIGFTSIASADYNLYGSLRAGAVYGDSDKLGSEAAWDLGATGNDGSIGGQGLYSRIGVKGSTDLGNGSSAGLDFERDVTGAGFSTRLTNVWVGGSWGKLTLGQQDNPHRNARNWDQTWFMGGQFFHDGGSHIEGVKYSSNLSGPFQFSIMATGNDSADGAPAVLAECTADNVMPAGTDGSLPGCADLTAYVAKVEGVDAVLNAAGVEVISAVTAVAEAGNRYQVTPASSSKSSVDRWILGASLDLGPVALNLSHNAVQVDNLDYDTTALGINGSAGGFDWYVAYETDSDNSARGNDKDSLGGFVSFSFSDSDSLYFYHVTHGYNENVLDSKGVIANGTDPTETVLGYSHKLGAGTTFIAEYLTLDRDIDSTAKLGNEPSTLALVLKVDF